MSAGGPLRTTDRTTDDVSSTLEDELQWLEQDKQELSPAQPAETAASLPPGTLDSTAPTPPDGTPRSGRRRVQIGGDVYDTGSTSFLPTRYSGKLINDTERRGAGRTGWSSNRLSRSLSGHFVDSQTEQNVALRGSTRICCSRHGKHPLMIDPFHPFNTFWDYVLAILCAYVAISIPFRIGFQVELCPDDTAWWVELCTDLFFAVDIVLNFRTGTVDIDGVVDLDPKGARSRYVKSWFLIDFMSVLPVTYIALAVTGSCGTGEHVRAFKVIRLVRLLKMLKLGQLRNVWALYKREVYGLEAVGKVFQVLAAALLILYMCHLVACMWFYSGTVGADAGQAAKNGWIAKAGIVTKSYTADTECPAFGAAADDCEADVRCVLNEVSGMCEAAALTPLAEQYLESFYWAITVLSTVGFGDITPASKVEKMFSILAELIGCVCFAMLMGSLANLFSQNALDSKVSAQVDELLQYCTRKQIPKQLVRKMVTIMEESYRQEAFSADDMMKRLPYAVRKDVETYSYRNLLTRVPLFREHLDSDDMSTQENKAAMEGLTAIMKLFKTLMIQPGEVVYSEGDPAFDFYIIIEGEIELSTTPATRLTHSDGSFFGERELFFSADTHKRRLAYSGPGRDAAENDNLHYLFGRNRYHTATVVSKSRAKLKFLRWDQLIHFLSMTLSTAQHDAGMKHPGPEIFRRIREAAVGRHLLEAEACRQQNRPAPGAEMSTESVIPEDCAAYDCLVAIRAAKKLQQRYRKYHKSAANKHREAARRDMKRLEQSHRGPRLPAGEDWDGSGTHLDAPIQSEAGVDKALFLELMAGQKEMKEMLGDLQVRVKRIEEQSET